MQEFKNDFYPGETVSVNFEGERFTGFIREKTKFPELVRPDGTLERKAFARYFCYLDDKPGEEALVDEEHVMRERKVFTKQRLRSFLKNNVSRESWTGAPWLVKPKIAEDFRINADVPDYLTHDFQSRQRKSQNYSKKGEYDGPQFHNFYGPHNGLPMLKPKGGKGKNPHEDMRCPPEYFAEYQRALASNSDFGKVTPQGQPVAFHPFHNGPQSTFRMVNGYQPIAAKGHPKPAPPPPPKYPIEDLEIPPARDGTHRPNLKFLSEDTPTIHRISEGVGSGISMASVGLLLETWDTLNVYCEVFQLDSFTFDDYVEALRFTSEDVQCELLVEIHCAVLKRLVNDVNDKNGQVQITLPDQPESEEDDSVHESSNQPTPTPEPETKPPARSTRSSLAKSEAAELKEAANALPVDTKFHRAVEMDHSTRSYDWKMRLRKRDFADGRWVVVIVGLLNQLSRNPRLNKSCNEILRHLAPLDKEATPETASSQYHTLDVNHRIRILQILCMKSLETKVIRQYMEECSAQMTEHRKEKNEVQRNRKAA